MTTRSPRTEWFGGSSHVRMQAGTPESALGSGLVDAHLMDVEALVQDVWLADPAGPASTGTTHAAGPVGVDPSASDNMNATLRAALSLIVDGLGKRHGDGEPLPPQLERDAQDEWQLAEEELARLIALRKRTQRTLKDLEKREAKARAARDKAKIVAKEAAKATKRS